MKGEADDRPEPAVGFIPVTDPGERDIAEKLPVIVIIDHEEPGIALPVGDPGEKRGLKGGFVHRVEGPVARRANGGRHTADPAVVETLPVLAPKPQIPGGIRKTLPRVRQDGLRTDLVGLSTGRHRPFAVKKAVKKAP